MAANGRVRFVPRRNFNLCGVKKGQKYCCAWGIFFFFGGGGDNGINKLHVTFLTTTHLIFVAWGTLFIEEVLYLIWSVHTLAWRPCHICSELSNSLGFVVDVRQGTWWAENSLLHVSKTSHLGKWSLFNLRIRPNTWIHCVGRVYSC